MFSVKNVLWLWRNRKQKLYAYACNIDFNVLKIKLLNNKGNLIEILCRIEILWLFHNYFSLQKIPLNLE